MGVVEDKPEGRGRFCRSGVQNDETVFGDGTIALQRMRSDMGDDIVPMELIPSADSRAIFVHLYGLNQWGQLFSDRQLLALLVFVQAMKQILTHLFSTGDDDYNIDVATALGTYFC